MPAVSMLLGSKRLMTLADPCVTTRRSRPLTPAVDLLAVRNGPPRWRALRSGPVRWGRGGVGVGVGVVWSMLGKGGGGEEEMDV